MKVVSVTFLAVAAWGQAPPGGMGDGIWLRDALFGERETFDTCFGHQPGAGQYHHHIQPVCLRAQLGDNLEVVASGRTGTTYRESAGAWRHSPILGWAYDGYPIYGPYGYSEQARRVVAYTKAAGGSIAAAEFMNEPNYAANGGAPKGYDAATFGKDIEVFRRFYRDALPGSLFLGPGSTGEGGVLGTMPTPGKLKTEDPLQATGPAFDVFSYHIYAAVSQRCGGAMPSAGTTAAAALSREWLSQPDKIHAFYAGLRDRYLPGKPLWLTEVADAACGGNPWASTYLDTFRFLNQHARLAQQGVQIIAHNTLSASDYGLLDERTLDPRPNYWAAVLWHRLMGRVVLNPQTQPPGDLYLYAHCQAGHSGGVTVMAINAGAGAREIETPLHGERYTLSATQPDRAVVQLNGKTLEAGSDGSLPPLSGAPVRAASMSLAPASITFVTFPEAGNAACR